MLGAGTPDETPLYGKPMHNEEVIFNEDILTKAPHSCILRVKVAMWRVIE